MVSDLSPAAAAASEENGTSVEAQQMEGVALADSRPLSSMQSDAMTSVLEAHQMAGVAEPRPPVVAVAQPIVNRMRVPCRNGGCGGVAECTGRGSTYRYRCPRCHDEWRQTPPAPRSTAAARAQAAAAAAVAAAEVMVVVLVVVVVGGPLPHTTANTPAREVRVMWRGTRGALHAYSHPPLPPRHHHHHHQQHLQHGVVQGKGRARSHHL